MKFTKEHVWFNGQNSTIGISDFAQESLGDIVFIDLPDPGETFAKGEQFGSVESVKSVSALFAPLSMRVVEVNELMEDQPEIINSDPYDKGWILKIEVLEEKEVEELLDQEDYLKDLD